MHSIWRDCKAWQDEGLPMSTCSNEAVKLYDAVLTQYIGWYDDAAMGGVENCMNKMVDADKNFVMGDVLRHGLELIGTGRTIRNDAKFAKDIQDLVTHVTDSVNVNDREKRHVKAIDLFAHGKMKAASHVWEDILLDYPTDLLALKLSHDTYFYLGKQVAMRDSVSRVMPHWKSSMPLYGYLHGMLSFGLVETNLFDEADKSARKALDINRHDAWATHTVAHVYEMTGKASEGISFMSRTVTDWETCGMLACHNFWHWALYHIERGEYDAAMGIFDEACISRASTSGALLDIVDICSLLFRLEMEGVDVTKRWQDVFTASRGHMNDHILVFNDAHMLMSCSGDNQKNELNNMMDGITKYMRIDSDGWLMKLYALIMPRITAKTVAMIIVERWNGLNGNHTFQARNAAISLTKMMFETSTVAVIASYKRVSGYNRVLKSDINPNGN